METFTLTYSTTPGTPFPTRRKFTTSRIGRATALNSMRSYAHTLSGNLHTAITTSPTCLNEPPVARCVEMPKSYLSTKLKTYHLFSGGLSRSSFGTLKKCTSQGTMIRRFIRGPVQMRTVWHDSRKSIRVIAMCSRSRIDFLLQSTRDLKTSSVASLSEWIRTSVPARIWDWSEYTGRSTPWTSRMEKIYFYWDGRTQSFAKLSNRSSSNGFRTPAKRVAPECIKIGTPPPFARSGSWIEVSESQMGSALQSLRVHLQPPEQVLKQGTTKVWYPDPFMSLSTSRDEQWTFTEMPTWNPPPPSGFLRSMLRKVTRPIALFFSRI